MAANGNKVGSKRRKNLPYNVILLDIEGTTTPITFVKDTLFPYARKNVEKYLNNNWESEECQQDIIALQKQSEKDKDLEGVISICKSEDIKGMDEKSRQNLINSVVKSVAWLMDADRKVTALKQLQGHIWTKGYEDGELKGEIYDDVVPALKRWTSLGYKVYIYSSGSVEAQKLLFGYSTEGNLLKFFSGHFDTKIGLKIESESYQNIAKSIEEDPSAILFVTDVVKEAEAATEAGVETVISVRPGNSPLSNADKQTYKTIESFDELLQDEDLDPKKKKTLLESQNVELNKTPTVTGV
ncbi:enolase-phosphatase E1 [Exaiptasia diaphana]|uniref:Enolase-phosphatase E1 n=1 Tax=Exaiptasia diaphana TaxID=2652724 RepID=A0A913X7V8_EXADI|nr:enolase-phosphatase E1 [Exaiptasia diaphana]KXJ14468.1 Enolase-phosphatase E1 [Exaiptasia diaphana]